MSKLWGCFQSDYRLSTGYEVSVVLIESKRAAKTPLPVLKRNVTAKPNLIPSYPFITSIELPNKQISALLGDILTINGYHLNGDTIHIRFNHADFAVPVDIPAMSGAVENQIRVQIPNNPVVWIVGFYTVAVVITKAGEQDRITNTLTFALSPTIVNIAPANPVSIDVSGNVTLTITCVPQVLPDQRATLLFGDREMLAEAHTVQTDTLVFVLKNAVTGNTHVRLRVDGVDSILIDRSVSPPVYIGAMEVIVV